MKKIDCINSLINTVALENQMFLKISSSIFIKIFWRNLTNRDAFKRNYSENITIFFYLGVKI